VSEREREREKLGRAVKRTERGAGPHVLLLVGCERAGWAASAHAREKGGPADCLVTRADEKRRWATRGKRKERVVGLGRKREERERRGICFFKLFFNF
jgi:hypothetical protein